MTILTFKPGDRWVVAAIHLIAWLLFAGLMYATRRLLVPTVSLIETIASTLPYMLTFYVSLVCYRLLNPQRILLGVLVFLVAFILLSIIAYLYYYRITPMSGMVLYSNEDVGHFLSQAIWSFIYMFGSATIYHVVPIMIKRERQVQKAENDLLKQKLENAQLRTKKLNAQKERLKFENAFIRSQINPHFLYNTLNTFIAETMSFSKPLADGMRDLTDILRYAMSSTDFKNDKITISKEWGMIKRLLSIHKLRYPQDNPVLLTTDGKPGLHLVPPMVLLTLVENALKYGRLDDPANPITIHLVLREGFFCFTCANAKIKGQQNKAEITSTYIGLNNVRYRLRQAFKDRHELKIQETDTHFTVQLTIQEPF